MREGKARDRRDLGSVMDSPFQVSDCRTSFESDRVVSFQSDADRDLLASPSPVCYQYSCSTQHLTPPLAAISPWHSPFRSPFDLSLPSISPILRSNHTPISPSTSSSTPFVQRLLSAR